MKRIILTDIQFGKGDIKMDKNTIIKVKEIEPLYREHCKKINVKFSKNDFARFLKFLEIDFHDWIKSNLKYFDQN